MSKTVTIQVPDIGDFAEVEVIELLVGVGDVVAEEQSLITLESDKASMEVPSPRAGKITALKIAVCDRVSEGSAILELEPADASEPAPSGARPAATPTASVEAPAPAAASGDKADHSCQVLVLGAGPGGYTAAFRAADLGLDVLLVERYPRLGGVCLNVGCIPSKALLHTAAILTETQEMAAHGITFGKPKIDLDKLRGFKDGVIGQLTKGLAGLAKQRKVRVLHGEASFVSPHELDIEQDGKRERVRFEHAIIAAGSQSARIPGFPYDDPRLVDSTGALELRDIPKRMLVIGGGIIGLEMACVYDALGSKVSVVELTGELIPGADRDLVRPLEKRIRGRYENIWLDTRVTGIEAGKKGLEVGFEGAKAPQRETFDRVLLAVGRTPNGRLIGADAAGVRVDERGFIPVDRQQRTNVGHIFAIGDIVGQPMLAHKATHEGKVAAEVIAGHKASFDALTIPSVAYTDPEVAWMGLTENDAKAQGVKYEKGVFPWAASGRSLSIGRSEGLTKVLVDPETRRILGAGLVGPNAGELIASAVVALEMGADAEDVGLSIHPHPTLSETFNFACEVVEGTVTDLYAPKKR
jgi:dihydrolipoamide dehydrogenase